MYGNHIKKIVIAVGVLALIAGSGDAREHRGLDARWSATKARLTGAVDRAWQSGSKALAKVASGPGQRLMQSAAKTGQKVPEQRILLRRLKRTLGLGSERKLLLMLYLDADNNLEEAGHKDLEEMLAGWNAANNPNKGKELTVVVHYDGWISSNETLGVTKGTKRFVIENGKMKELADLGELDSGNPAAASDFFDSMITTYDADRYIAIYWDHGAGPFTHCSDDTSNTTMRTIDSAKSVAALLEKHNREDVVLIKDQCLMGMAEVAMEYGPRIGCVSASPEVLPADGGWYNGFVKALAEKPDMDRFDITRSWVTTLSDSYNDGAQGTLDITCAGYDMREREQFTRLTRQFFALAKGAAESGSEKTAMRDAMSRVLSYYYTDNKDLVGVVRAISGASQNSELKSAGEEYIKFLTEKFVFINKPTGRYNKSNNEEASSGIAVYFPLSNALGFINDRWNYDGYRTPTAMMNPIRWASDYDTFQMTKEIPEFAQFVATLNSDN